MLKRVRGIRVAMVIGVVVAVLITACNSDDPAVTLPEEVTLPEVTLPETQPPQTEAPTTEAPPPETPATDAPADTNEAEGDEVPVWVWVLLGLVLVGLVAWLGARAGTRRGSQVQQYPPQQPPPPPSEQPPSAPSTSAEPPEEP